MAELPTDSTPQPDKGRFGFPSAVTTLAIVTVLVWFAALFVPAGKYSIDADESDPGYLSADRITAQR